MTLQLNNIYQSALERTPNKTAVIIDNTSCTYQQLHEQVLRYTMALSRLGIRKGDCIGLFSENRLEMIYLYFACFRLGAIAVPSSYYSSPSELAYEYQHCGVKHVFVSKDRQEIIADHLNDTLNFLTVSLLQNDADWLQTPPSGETPPVSMSPSHPALILYTSGSTGKTKGVTHTHFSLLNGTIQRCETIRQDATSTFLTASYLCHGAAPTIGLFPALYTGGTVIFMQHFTAGKYATLLKEHHVTHAVSSPLQWKEILKHINKTDDLCLQYASAGGDTVPAALQRKFARTTRCPLAISLGMTECGVCLTTAPGEVIKLGSLGRPVLGYDIRLLNEDGIPVEQGDVGEFVVRSKAVAIGYWNDPENTNRFFRDGWYHSGDLGYKDINGYYYYTGRCKNTIIRGGGNIAPGEIEDVLITHPAVKACAVCGVPDETQGETVFAFVAPTNTAEPPTTSALEEFLLASISERKLPEFWHFTDEIPHNAEGSKVDRAQLREQAVNILNRT